MSCDRIKKILEAPALPIEKPSLDVWREMQDRYGELPKDYVDFIELYGSGCIDDFVWIFNPASSNINLNFSLESDSLLAAMSQVKEWVEGKPYPLYPAPGGILPVGKTDNGDVICWKTDGLPDDWPIVVVESRGIRCEEFGSTLVVFLTKILRRETMCHLFPLDFPSNSPQFYSTNGQ